jgi:hypothetical protein
MVLSPDSKVPPQDAQKFWESVTEKNNFCVITGDGSSLGNLEEKTRRIWAVAKVREDTGGDKSPHLAELQEEAEQAEQDFNSTVVSLFNRVYYPAKDGLKAAKLAMTFTANAFRAEDQIEKALSDIGTSKLYPTLAGQEETLMVRAEDMLWPGIERRSPWRDVVMRSVSNPRWIWLPPKGLEKLKELALGQGRWRWSEDGYIEKGPFPVAKTSVSVSERDYNQDTGEATIEVIHRNSGMNGRIHYSTESTVSPASPVIPDSIFTTKETRLYFLAVDPDGQHEVGEITAWSNKLTLTHMNKELPGKRLVTLSVVPKGLIRWNTTGENPREGTEYDCPIELTVNEEVTIYAYAEDNGVSANRNFKIPKPDGGGFYLDKSKPAKLRKKVECKGNSDAFSAINATKAVQAKLGGVSVEIGEGSHNVVTRFGSDSIISSENLDRFVSAARTAIGDETADVRISFRDIQFNSGHDLEEFLQKLDLKVTAGEVEQ